MTKEEYNYWKPQIAEYEKEQLRLSRVRRSCSCGEDWEIDTNKYVGEHDPFVCCICGGYVTIDQVPKGMKFKEKLGTY